MPDNSAPEPEASTSLRPWASLAYRDYSFLFLLALFATTGQQMRQTQNFYQVYELSNSAFMLGLTGLAQGIPIFALGIFGGAIADFLDRKKILLMTVFGNLLVALILAVLTLTDLIQVWHILAATALTSALNIVLNPTRMALISHLVPRSHLTNAVALNSSVSQAAHFVGPMLGGLSLAWMSTGNAYLLNALFYLPAAVSVFLLMVPAVDRAARERFSLTSFLGGIKFLFSEPIILTLVLLDFVIVGVGYYRPHAFGGAGNRRSARNFHSARHGRREEQRAAGPMGVSRLRGGSRRVRRLDGFLVVASLARLYGLGQFPSGGHAPDQLPSAYTRRRAGPCLRRLQHVLPGGEFGGSYGSRISGGTHWSARLAPRRQRRRCNPDARLLGFDTESAELRRLYPWPLTLLRE